MTIAEFEAKVDQLTDANEWRAAQTRPTNVNEVYERSFSTVDRLAVWVTDNVGSMGFFFIIAVWTVVGSPGTPSRRPSCASTRRRHSCCGCSSAT